MQSLKCNLAWASLLGGLFFASKSVKIGKNLGVKGEIVHLFLQGQRGIGKSTAIQKAIELLKEEAPIRVGGFFTYKESRQRIKDICNDATLQSVLSIYPWNKNPLKYRLFNYGFRKHMVFFLYVLGKMRKL